VKIETPKPNVEQDLKDEQPSENASKLKNEKIAKEKKERPKIKKQDSETKNKKQESKDKKRSVETKNNWEPKNRS
jgi:hypothetical protein